MPSFHGRSNSAGPPPPTNFPKRQDYHEASGGSGRQGGGRHSGGRGGRHGDKGRHGGEREWFGGGGRHNRHNSGAGQGYAGGGRRFQSENLVAEMKLGASGHGDASLRVKCPPFQEVYLSLVLEPNVKDYVFFLVAL